ncbi:MAG: hypothetical protein HKP37_08085 [Boseongicola sp.]|nr:ERF family protein [Boseongicola sp.]NNL18681.1 hypothetical protein [Boseongicola sp.]
MTEYTFETSPELDKLAPALVAFQKAVKDPQKNSTNPHFRSKFASLEDSITAIRHVANDCGFSITQWRVGHGVSTFMLHTSGQWIRGDAELIIEKLTPQALGSATTYERRYSLLGATGTSGDVDDDAESAMQREAPQPADDIKQVKRFIDSIGGAETLEGLNMVGKTIQAAHLTDTSRSDLKAIYLAKKHELENE